jgi:BA14K-like protein
MNSLTLIFVSATTATLLSACAYDRGYYAPRVTSEPGPYVASDGYTQAYLDSCARRYRSFDPVDGTYLGYDGLRHVCVL